MRSIRLTNIKKSKDRSSILNGIDLFIPAGKFFALLGPSGCGKTTLLRIIAGLETVDSGSIFLGDQEITHMPVHTRPINVVFQNYALFPHLNVFENISYSLQIRRLPKEEIKSRVFKLIKAFHLENHVSKLPKELSGGQQQRVAIARAIISEPEVLLLDEPLAALDLKLREKMLIELIDLQAKLSTTFIYVTHDQGEALTVADHMAIMGVDGQIAQMGTPKEIYEFPGSSYVAQFVGNTNIFEGEMLLLDGRPHFQVPGIGSLEVSPTHSSKFKLMSLRPEKIFISKLPLKGFSNCLKGTVSSIVYTGRSTIYEVKVGEKKIQVFEQNEDHVLKQEIDYDDLVFLYWFSGSSVLLEG